jgi:hypothetical protein
MKKYFITALCTTSLFILIGCGSDSKADPSEENSGETATLSISYESTECDVNRGVVSHYHIHAVDSKSHLPLENIPVSVSLINGVKEFNDEKVHKGTGVISKSTDGDGLIFSDSTVDFQTTRVQEGDNLIVFPSTYRTNIAYLGGWNINEVSNTLTLNGNYKNIPEVNSLTYIVGNEERLLGGEYGEIGELATAHVEIIDNETNADGYVYFDIVYDFILAGHTVSVEAHGDKYGERAGIAEKIFLRLDGDNFTAYDQIVPNSMEGIQYVWMNLRINPSCSGDFALMNVPIDPRSFTAEPIEHCHVDVTQTGTETDGYGNVLVAVQTDGNSTDAPDCTVKWNGGPASLRFEY